MKKPLKSFLAVLAGLIFIFLTHTTTDTILQKLGFLPKDNLFVSNSLILIVVLYRAVLSFIGCYLTAYLAPQNPLKHSLILGTIGALFSILGAIANAMLNLGPAWYVWTLVVISIPISYLAGKAFLRFNQRNSSQE